MGANAFVFGFKFVSAMMSWSSAGNRFYGQHKIERFGLTIFFFFFLVNKSNTILLEYITRSGGRGDKKKS